MIRGCVLATVLTWGLAGCGDDSAADEDSGGTTFGVGSSSDSASDDDGEANTFPTVEVSVDPSAACGADGTLLLRVTQTGCVNPPPAPCTVPDPPRQYESEALACPSTATEAPMRVAIELPGRFVVELVTVAADGTETVGACFSDTSESEVIVDEAAFDQNPTIVASELAGC